MSSHGKTDDRARSESRSRSSSNYNSAKRPLMIDKLSCSHKIKVPLNLKPTPTQPKIGTTESLEWTTATVNVHGATTSRSIQEVKRRTFSSGSSKSGGANFSHGARATYANSNNSYKARARSRADANVQSHLNKPGSGSSSYPKSTLTVEARSNRLSKAVPNTNSARRKVMSDKLNPKSNDKRRSRFQTKNDIANHNRSRTHNNNTLALATKKPLTLVREKVNAGTTLATAKTPTRSKRSFCWANGTVKRDHIPNGNSRQSCKSALTSSQLEGKNKNEEKSISIQCKSILRKGSDPDHQEKHEAGASTKHVKFKKSKDMQQASLRSKLNDWLEAKGKTPSHCRHLICFDAQMSAERKKPKPVYGQISSDVLDKQENALKKEELNSRKRLFDGTYKTEKSPVFNQLTPKNSNSDSDSERRILTPSGLSNTTPVRSPSDSYDIKSRGQTENQYDFNLSNSFDGASKMTPSQAGGPDHYQVPGSVLPSRTQTIPDQKILDNLNSMLEECLTLYKAGCPVQNILPWLHEIDTNIPQAQTFAPYYACKAKVFSENPQQVLDILCTAVENNAQPAEVLAKAMRDLLSDFCPPSNFSHESPAPLQVTPALSQSSVESPDVGENPSTGQPHTPLLQQQNQTAADLGSTIKYSVIPSRLLPGQTPETVPLAKVTPIRRSLRLSNRQQTPYRKELDSMSDLTLREAEATVYQPNPALVD